MEPKLQAPLCKRFAIRSLRVLSQLMACSCRAAPGGFLKLHCGMTPQFFRYILASDVGMAPCGDDGLLALATCKPVVRRVARPGDWVAGFLPRPHDRGLLAYAGRVQKVLAVGKYENLFRGRSDAIYRERRDRSFQRLKPEYHDGPGDFARDLSADVLVFDMEATWYFGDRPQVLPKALIHLAAAGRGHRVNGATYADITALERWLRRHWLPGIAARAKGRPGSIAQCIVKPRSKSRACSQL